MHRFLFLLISLAMPVASCLGQVQSKRTTQPKAATHTKPKSTASLYQVRTLYNFLRRDGQAVDSGFVRIGGYYKVTNVRLTALRHQGYAESLMKRFNRILQYPFVADSLNSLPYSSKPVAYEGNVKEPPKDTPMSVKASYIKQVVLLITPNHDSLLNVTKVNYEGSRDAGNAYEYHFVVRAGRVMQLLYPEHPDSSRRGLSLERRLLKDYGQLLTVDVRKQFKISCSPSNLSIRHLIFEPRGLGLTYQVCLPAHGEKFKCEQGDISEDRDNIAYCLIPYSALNPSLFSFAIPQR